MTITTPAVLKSQMPVGTRAGTSAQDLHDVIDTFEDRTSQTIITTNANYTATVGDNRRRIVFDALVACTLTLPNNLPQGWECMVIQRGVGDVTVTVAAGGARLSRDSHTRLAGQYSSAYILVLSNTGTAAQVLFNGDTRV